MQETFLNNRLNAALDNHDKQTLEVFLPYLKLLLAGLYKLPLVQVPTYVGVKLELFQVSDLEFSTDVFSVFHHNITLHKRIG